MKTISICNHKGGVGKTTSALALAQGISALHPRAKVLLIDADPQGTATKSFFGIKNDVPGLYDVITKDVDIEGVTQEGIDINDAIITTEAGHILPYSPRLRSLDAQLQNDPGKNFFLRERLEDLKGYTHVIIDTSPYVNLVNVQALTASDAVIIPIGSSPETVENLPDTLKTINQVKKYLNKDLSILGALITLYDGRSNVVKQYGDFISGICKKHDVHIIKTRIRTCSAAIHETHALKADLFKHAPKSNAVADYTAVIKELKL